MVGKMEKKQTKVCTKAEAEVREMEKQRRICWIQTAVVTVGVLYETNDAEEHQQGHTRAASKQYSVKSNRKCNINRGKFQFPKPNSPKDAFSSICSVLFST